MYAKPGYLAKASSWALPYKYMTGMKKMEMKANIFNIYSKTSK